MTCPPLEPHDSLVPFVPMAERQLSLFGATATLILVPSRKARQDRATDDRPAFRRSPAARIVREEAFWRRDGLAVTPNRYPFAREQRILWPEQSLRDPDLVMWTAIAEWAAASDGTVLVNNVGAASTIGRAHAHLLPERLPFLEALRECAGPPDLVDLPPGVEFVAKDVPFCLLGVRGRAGALAGALLHLAEARLTAAWNVVVQRDTAWLFPRRLETPAPHFPYALGAAEVWGRWCYVDEEPFSRATAPDLEQALVAAGAEALR